MTEIFEEMAEEKGLTYDNSNPKFQIVDMNFAKTDLKDVQILFRMNRVRKEMKQIEARKAKSSGDGSGCCGSTFEKQLEKK